MNPKKAREGNDTAGLLRYLYGPGKRDEHLEPRMVGAWDPGIDDPARSPNMTISDLALLLDAPVRALRGKEPAKHVYHVAVRNAPEDPLLSDEQWAEVAREMLHAAGIAPHGDDQGCRWVAVRHADDHIHIVATMARQDGRQPNVWQDIVKMQARARRFETQWGLRLLTSGDKTANRWPKTGEAEKAARRQLPEPARVMLHRVAREAAALAQSDADFFARLEAAGVRVKQRGAPDGNVTGYAIALPGDRDNRSTPVWFSGAKLAPDLSLPRVRERWHPAAPTATAVAPAEAWRIAEEKVRAAAGQLGAGGLRQGAGDVAALGDLIAAAAGSAPALVRSELRAAVVEYERAGRAPGARQLDGQARALYRTAAWTLARVTSAAGRNDVAAVLGLLVALATAVVAVQRWHQAQEYRAQAQAAGRAGKLLWEAVEVTAGAVAARDGRPRARGASAGAGSARRTPSSSVPAAGAGVGGTMAAAVRAAVPGHAEAVLADEVWPALRKRLMDVERGGEDPREVLTAVAARRELGSAQSVAEVLTWRLDGWLRARTSASPAPAGGAAKRASSGATKTIPGRSAQPFTGPSRVPGGDQHEGGPRRAR